MRTSKAANKLSVLQGPDPDQLLVMTAAHTLKQSLSGTVSEIIFYWSKKPEKGFFTLLFTFEGKRIVVFLLSFVTLSRFKQNHVT